MKSFEQIRRKRIVLAEKLVQASARYREAFAELERLWTALGALRASCPHANVARFARPNRSDKLQSCQDCGEDWSQ